MTTSTGSTIANSTSCVPRSERANRRTKSEALFAVAAVACACLAFTCGLLPGRFNRSSSLVEHGLRELRVDWAAARLVAVLAEHDSLAYVLGLHVAARAALHLRLKEEGSELVELHGVASG